MTQLRVVSDERKREKGRQNPASSILKLKGSVIQQQLTELLMEVVGPYVMPYQRDFDGNNEPVVGPDYATEAAPMYFNYRKVSIYGGSNEIQRNIIAKAILGPVADAWRLEGLSMDFDLTEDQRLLKDSVDRLIADHYQFEQRKKYLREPAGCSAADVGPDHRTRPAGPAVRGNPGRLRRRRGGNRDRDGGVRPRPGAGALFRHRHPGRRPAAPRRVSDEHAGRRWRRRSPRAS